MTKMLLAMRWLQRGSPPARSAVALSTVATNSSLVSTNAATKYHHTIDTFTCECHYHRAFRSAAISQQRHANAVSQQQPCSVPRRLKSTAAVTYDSDEEETGTHSPQKSTSTTTIPFKLADIGEGIKEVELLQW